MSKCKACNQVITPFLKEVILEGGSLIKIEEDLCSKCIELSWEENNIKEDCYIDLPKDLYTDLGEGSYIKKPLPGCD